MKKAILIIISILLLSCFFALTAFAAPAEAQLLRAGGAVGGGGGGGFGGFSRSHRSSKTAENLKDMTGNDMFGMFLFYLLYFAFYLISLLGSILIPIIVHKRKKKAREETRRLMAEYDDFDGFWSFEFVQKRIKEVYFGIQHAWRDNNIKNAEDMLTPALFNRYQKHLSAQRRDGEKNIMKNIELKTAEPVYAKDFTNNEHDYFWAKIEGSMIDYVIIEETGVIVQGTKQEVVFTEYWKFTRRRDGNWVLAEIMQQYDFEKTKYYKGLDKL